MKPAVTWHVVVVATTMASAAMAQPPLRAAQGQGVSDSVGRVRLENQIRRMFTRAVRERVGLTDDQMTRLAPVTSKYEQQRRQLQLDERDTRIALRTALTADATDQKKVDDLLQRMLDVQKRRVRILEAEQSDLAAIMTPVQRARYMALQEQIRRRLEQMRQRRMQLMEDEMSDAPRPRPRLRRPPP